MATPPADPHGGERVYTAGAPLRSARAAMVMVHGRGASAESILSLAPEFGIDGVACLAPQAHGGTWYPYGFMSPVEMNEPGISSAMRAMARVLAGIAEAGIPLERTVLLGFSQGACLSSEFMARNARRYGGLAALSGGLIGPDGTPRNYPGHLEGTPVFFGCSDIDPHIPAPRVEQSAEVMRSLGGKVDLRLYPGMGHTVNADEIAVVRGMLVAATG